MGRINLVGNVFSLLLMSSETPLHQSTKKKKKKTTYKEAIKGKHSIEETPHEIQPWKLSSPCPINRRDSSVIIFREHFHDDWYEILWALQQEVSDFKSISPIQPDRASSKWKTRTEDYFVAQRSGIKWELKGEIKLEYGVLCAFVWGMDKNLWFLQENWGCLWTIHRFSHQNTSPKKVNFLYGSSVIVASKLLTSFNGDLHGYV